MSEEPLNDCGCCENAEEKQNTPRNLPGLPALAYRAGTHAQFKNALHVALSMNPALRGLATRDNSDPTVALIDSWAVVLDVLSFYQERIANEGFLRTAVERLSILELARAIGYELHPGVAANVFLEFTVEKPPPPPVSGGIVAAATPIPGAPVTVRVPIGTKAQHVPGQDEKPQTFETIEELEARPEWNALRPQQLVASLPLKNGDKTLHLQGTATNLKPGDALLLIGDERKDDSKNENWEFRLVASVDLFPNSPLPGAGTGYTRVILDRGLGEGTTTPPQKKPEVYALRQRAAIFGYNAHDWKALPHVTKCAYLGVAPETKLSSDQLAEWPNFTTFSSANEIDLEAAFPKIIARGGWVVLSTPSSSEVFPIKRAVESARAEFGLSGKTTRITLGEGENTGDFTKALRTTVVYAESEQLLFADQPRTDHVMGGEILISPAVAGLTPGRLLSLTGIDSASAKLASEIVQIKAAEPQGGNLRVTVSENLNGSYLRESVTINANVARATHGETKEEPLGSGDGSIAFQRFTLKNKPLTFISAPVTGGAKSTLNIRVKSVLWREAPSFYLTSPSDRVFVTRRAEDGTTTVQFGDGRTGARLPTGPNNVVASYRTGLGLAGRVKANTITTLLSRPLGLRAVNNPIPATGGAEPEQLVNARINAPLTVLTLDRVVSLQDFEDYARGFAGIGKARATLLWNGERRLVHLTIAGTGGATVDPASELFKILRDGIDSVRHAWQPISISPHVPRKFTVKARVAVEPDRLQVDVFAAIKAALASAFSFESRGFGQGVTASEVLAVMQNVEGVIAVDLDELDGLDPIAEPNVPAQVAHWDTTVIKGADLLTMDPIGISLTNLPL